MLWHADPSDTFVCQAWCFLLDCSCLICCNFKGSDERVHIMPSHFWHHSWNWHLINYDWINERRNRWRKIIQRHLDSVLEEKFTWRTISFLPRALGAISIIHIKLFFSIFYLWNTHSHCISRSYIIWVSEACLSGPNSHRSKKLIWETKLDNFYSKIWKINHFKYSS